MIIRIPRIALYALAGIAGLAVVGYLAFQIGHRAAPSEPAILLPTRVIATEQEPTLEATPEGTATPLISPVPTGAASSTPPLTTTPALGIELQQVIIGCPLSSHVNVTLQLAGDLADDYAIFVAGRAFPKCTQYEDPPGTYFCSGPTLSKGALTEVSVCPTGALATDSACLTQSAQVPYCLTPEPTLESRNFAPEDSTILDCSSLSDSQCKEEPRCHLAPFPIGCVYNPGP